MQMEKLLQSLNACNGAMKWANGKEWPEIFETCHRGDWLLWLFRKTNPQDKRLLTLAKGHCANTVRHLMKDERCIQAVDAAIAYGNSEILECELAAAYSAAYAAADAAAADADADVAYAAAAAYSAAAYADADADVAYAAAAAYSAAAYADAYADAAAYAAARKKSHQQAADICRKYLPIEVWNITPDGQLIIK